MQLGGQRISFGFAIAEAVRHGRSLMLDDGRLSIACAPSKRGHIVMSYENGSWIVPETVNSGQIALKYTDHHGRFSDHMQQQHIGDQKLSDLIVQAAIRIFVEERESGGEVGRRLIER